MAGRIDRSNAQVISLRRRLNRRDRSAHDTDFAEADYRIVRLSRQHIIPLIRRSPRRGERQRNRLGRAIASTQAAQANPDDRFH